MTENKIHRLQMAKDYAQSRGGQCLSREYTTNKDKLVWKCENNQHPQWECSYDNAINKKSWCMHCSGKLKKDSQLGLKEAQEHAQSKGGQCLSLEYLGRQKTLVWKCSNIEHNSWLAPTDLVIHKNTWCPQCAAQTQSEVRKDKSGLEKAQMYAQSRGGQCLSTEYKNQNTQLEWKCGNEKHTSWLALPKIANRGTWCTHCSREKKTSPELCM